MRSNTVMLCVLFTFEMEKCVNIGVGFSCMFAQIFCITYCFVGSHLLKVEMDLPIVVQDLPQVAVDLLVNGLEFGEG